MIFGNAHAWYIDQRKKGWHKWFAWYPVDVDVDKTAWLCFVERAIIGLNDASRTSTATWQYRLLDNPIPTDEK